MNGTLVEHLRSDHRVFVDSMVVIYFIEQNPAYLPIVRPLFEFFDSGKLVGMSSCITLLEVMVRPFKEGRLDLVRQYRNILTRSRGFALFPVDQRVAERGAEIRAKHNDLRTPDAIQLATGVLYQAEAFVTNDSRLPRLEQLEVLNLDDFLE